MIDEISNFLIKNYEWLITIVAGITAIFSAFFSFKGNKIASKALNLSKQEYKDKQANFSIYLIDSFRYLLTNSRKRNLLFNITISNKSDSKNSFRVTLQIEYIRADNSVAKAIIDHSPVLIENIRGGEFSIFPIDIKIDEKSMESKWVIFEQPDYIIKMREVWNTRRPIQL